MTPKNKLLVFASTFPRFKNDTIPPFVYELSKRLIKDFDVHVLAPSYPGARDFDFEGRRCGMKKNIKRQEAYTFMTNISQNWLNKIDSASLEIAEIFTRGYDKKSHGSEIARISGLPQKTVSRKLNALCKIGILKFIREGRNKIYFINKESHLTTSFYILVENYKSTKFMARYREIGILLKELPCGALIFGSYSNGTADKNSDLDILLLTKKGKKVQEVLARMPIDTHPQFSTLDDLKDKIIEKNALALEIKDNHVIINDIERTVKMFLVVLHE